MVFLSDLSNLLEQPDEGHVAEGLHVLDQGPGLLAGLQLLEAGVHLGAEGERLEVDLEPVVQLPHLLAGRGNNAEPSEQIEL